MGGERGRRGMGAGKTFSSEKFNFSLRHPREWGEGGRWVVHISVFVCVCAKGIHFQPFYHTPLSTDMLVCFFFLFFSRDPHSTNICAYY